MNAIDRDRLGGTAQLVDGYLNGAWRDDLDVRVTVLHIDWYWIAAGLDAGEIAGHVQHALVEALL